MKLKRLQCLEEYILSHEVCSYDELCEEFGVSMSTIRRDVDTLAKKDIFTKTHAGIVANEGVELPEKKMEYDYGKDRIAKAAADLVKDNDIITLGSGSTVAHMIRHLGKLRNVTIITNNLRVLEGSKKLDSAVVSIGGNLDRTTMSFVGARSIRQIRDLNCDKVFISCNGVILNSISNVSEVEADIKRAAMSISKEVILLVDSSKFDVMSLYSFADWEDIDTVITDKQPSEEFLQRFKEANVKVIVV